jgi:glycogen debranching enzyme
MKEYTERMASLFHGFRIDNCHSTPIHVAQYLLDHARRMNPNLYVVAELFTNSEELDMTYVTRMGLNSLIREAMMARDAFELSRQIYRYGGLPMGSISLPPRWTFLGGVPDRFSKKLGSTGIHGLLMDCTHDNEPAPIKRTFEDILSTGCLVPWSVCATGSTKGYDELFTKKLDITKSGYHYPISSMNQGSLATKSILLTLKRILLERNYCEIHVHHERDFIVVHRKHPDTQVGYLIVSRTAFSKYASQLSG